MENAGGSGADANGPGLEKLQEYIRNRRLVEDALEEDPQNVDLMQLEMDLSVLIDLTRKKLLEEAQRSNSDNSEIPTAAAAQTSDQDNLEITAAAQTPADPDNSESTPATVPTTVESGIIDVSESSSIASIPIPSKEKEPFEKDKENYHHRHRSRSPKKRTLNSPKKSQPPPRRPPRPDRRWQNQKARGGKGKPTWPCRPRPLPQPQRGLPQQQRHGSEYSHWNNSRNPQEETYEMILEQQFTIRTPHNDRVVKCNRIVF